MTGLDRIVAKIAEESKQKTDSIIAEARQTADEIIAEAKAESQKEADKIIAAAKAEADRKIAVARSAAEAVTRNRYLKVRNAVVNDIISAAYEKITKMDDEAYFDLLFAICVKNIEKNECKMYLNERDLARMPEGFEDRINQAVYETSAVQISDTPKDIENGFVLVYGDMEVNCTLKAVFDESMDRLKDILSSILFN